MYHNSSTNSTKIIGKTPKISPIKTLSVNVSGKSTKTTKIRLIYANIHIRVGTGPLTHFRSAPGLSNILYFLKIYQPIEKTNIIIKKERMYVIVTLYFPNDIK
jgi:hypothetical protein